MHKTHRIVGFLVVIVGLIAWPSAGGGPPGQGGGGGGERLTGTIRSHETIGRIHIGTEDINFLRGGELIDNIDMSMPAPVSCPWDCGDDDGDVGIVDFLALLAEWDLVDTPCDFDGGGVGIVDFLKLLANWGPCPASFPLCGAGNGSCCFANGTPGCEQVACCESVCGADPYCCDVDWDAMCAEMTATDPNCDCAGPCGPGTGNCCVANGTPGCDDAVCCTSVCTTDPFCCDNEWDGLCADTAAVDPNCTCLGVCGHGNGNCCVANGTPGCDDAVCCTAICLADPFCCDIEWDGLCTDAAAADPNCTCP